MDNLPPFFMELIAVFDPNDGHGLIESILAVIVFGGVFALLFMQIEVPSWIIGIFTFIGGAWLGGQARTNMKRTK